jgi:hypothetical protein
VLEEQRLTQRLNLRAQIDNSKPRVPPTPKEWLARFHAHATRNASCRGLLSRLAREGCDITVVEELLYSAAEVCGRPMAAYKKETRQLQKEAKRFISDQPALVRLLRRLNEWLIPEEWEGESCRVVVNRKQVDVPLEWLEYLPETIESYTQFLDRMLRISDMKGVDDHEPDMAILAAYLTLKTKRAPYHDLSLLVDDAHACIGWKCDRGPEAIRKTLGRYKKDHPKVQRLIGDSVGQFEQLGARERALLGTGLVTHVRNVLKDRALLYQRSGRTP